MNLKKMTLKINGADRMFICDPEKDTLADVVRRLGLTGTKVGCGTGVCGACSVIPNGKDFVGGVSVVFFLYVLVIVKVVVWSSTTALVSLLPVTVRVFSLPSAVVMKSLSALTR